MASSRSRTSRPDAGSSAAACHSAKLLLRSIAHARELLWQTVHFAKGDAATQAQPGVSCEQILDWPHQAFLTWDEHTHPGTAYPRVHCNVFDRLPQFQLQLQPRAAPRAHAGRTSLDPGGACHMGRLRRLALPETADVLQHCAGLERGLACRYYDPATGRSAVRTEDEAPAPAPPQPAPSRAPAGAKHRPCAACESHREGAFVAPDGALRDTPAARRMLSTGEHVHVSTARMVSAYLRRLVCSLAAEAPCPALLRVFNTSHWTSGAFLQGLFAAANGSTDFYVRPAAAPAAAPAPASGPAPAAAAPPPSDAALWARSWVWCDPRESTCVGSVAKPAWVDPRTRGPACRAAIA